MSNQSKNKTTNQVMASVLLKNATVSLEETVINCKSLITDVIDLPRGSSVTKQLLCLVNQLNHIETIAKTINVEISPYINITHNTGYLHKRLMSLHSSSTSHIPSTMNANLLPLPPSLSIPAKISSLSSSKSNATTSTSSKKRPVLHNISTNTNNRKSKRVRLRTFLPTRTQIMPIPPTGHTCFSVQDAMQEYGKYSGKGKMKLIQYWINNNYIPCQKT